MAAATSTATPASATVSDLQDALRTVALAAAIKSKAISTAKAAIPEGSSHSIEFGARISASVLKGHEERGVDRQVQASVSLCNKPAIAELLDRLGVTPQQLKSTLRQVAKKSAEALREANQELQAAFEDIETKAAAKLPSRTVPGSVRAASVRVEATVDFVD